MGWGGVAEGIEWGWRVGKDSGLYGVTNYSQRKFFVLVLSLCVLHVYEFLAYTDIKCHAFFKFSFLR